MSAGLVVGSVTTSKSPVLYVSFSFYLFFVFLFANLISIPGSREVITHGDCLACSPSSSLLLLLLLLFLPLTRMTLSSMIVKAPCTFLYDSREQTFKKLLINNSGQGTNHWRLMSHHFTPVKCCQCTECGMRDSERLLFASIRIGLEMASPDSHLKILIRYRD